MSEPLRVVVADDEEDMRQYFSAILPRLGHAVVAVAEDGRQLVEYCQQLKPDLVISDIKMPDMDGIEAAAVIYQTCAIPIILVSAFHDADLIERATADHIMAYLVKPIRQTDLQPAISLVTRRFEQFQSLQQEAADLRQALEDRKTIEKAKGVLMRRIGLDENQAFGRLQKLSCDKNTKMAEIAKQILFADEAFNPTTT